MNTSPVLSVVVPAYAEEEHIENSVRTIHATCRQLGVSFELIVVDDGSPDKTWSVLEKLSQELVELRCLGLSRNFGKEGAMRAGLEAALGGAIIVMDCDLQHPPQLIPQMYALWKEQGFMVVNAVKKSRGKESLLNRFGSFFFYGLVKFCANCDLNGSSDFKLLDRKVLDVYLAMPERKMFFRGLVQWIGFPQTNILFEVPERIGGTSKWSPFQLARLALDVIVSFSTLPLHFVTWCGILFSILALGMSCHTLFMWATGRAVPGFATVNLLILFTGSIVMYSLGIIGEYLAKIGTESVNRPRYVLGRYAQKNRSADFHNLRSSTTEERKAA